MSTCVQADAKRMTLTFPEAQEDGEDLVVPGKWEVCDRCNGRGTHDHPAFSNGVTSGEWAEMCYEDCDFPGDYMAGKYDVPCEECNGRTTVLVVDYDRVTPEVKALVEEWYESEWESRMVSEAERRMGA